MIVVMRFSATVVVAAAAAAATTDATFSFAISVIDEKWQRWLTLMVTWPCNFSISPRIAETSDDFPTPTWPTTASNDEHGTCRLMLLHNDSTPVHAAATQLKLSELNVEFGSVQFNSVTWRGLHSDLHSRKCIDSCYKLPSSSLFFNNDKWLMV